jgi:hypothetical protein
MICWMLTIAFATGVIGAFADNWLVVMAQPNCVPGMSLGPQDVPFEFDHDANDILLPLFPGDPTRWDLPKNRTWMRPPAMACDPDDQAISVVCMWYEINGQEVLDRSQWPQPNYDPNTATWSPMINVKPGISKAIFRATDTDVDVESDDFTLVWRGKNRKPILH